MKKLITILCLLGCMTGYNQIIQVSILEIDTVHLPITIHPEPQLAITSTQPFMVQTKDTTLYRRSGRHLFDFSMFHNDTPNISIIYPNTLYIDGRKLLIIPPKK